MLATTHCEPNRSAAWVTSFGSVQVADFTGDQSEPSARAALDPAVGKQLHAEADAHEPAAVGDVGAQRGIPTIGLKSRHR